MPNDETGLKVLRLLEVNPNASQRDLASEFGFSLGKVNYCIRALVQKGWIKSNRFRNSDKKLAYRYLLTPRGLEQKAVLAARFLRIKIREYDRLRAEIEQLRREVGRRGDLVQGREH